MKDPHFNFSGSGDEGKKIPAAISEYIKRFFDKEFLTEIKTSKDKKGMIFYHVNVSQDNTLYHLKFNTEGILVQKDSEPLMELLDDEDEIAD